MKRTSLFILLGLVFFSCCLIYFGSSKAQSVSDDASPQTNSQGVQLFDFLSTKTSRSSASDAGVAEQEVVINFDKLDFEKVQRLALPLFDGKIYEAIRKESEGFVRFAPDEYSWRGRIFGDNNWTGDVVLTVKGRAMSGLIYSPEAVYEIVPQRDFKHLLVQIDQSQFPPCGGAVAQKPKFESEQSMLPSQPSLDAGSQIDIMIVYTASVRSALGGTTQTQAFAQQAISTTNTVYQNSGIATRLRLVQTMEVGYADNDDGLAGLEWVTNDTTVAAARNTAKADMVALLTENADDVCGIAWIMTNVGPSFASSAFSLTQRTCAISGLAFPHELGHNQACDHNPENATLPASQLAYPYAFGHWNASADFRTVMSYSNPCPSCERIAYFSNPSITHNGIAIGIANQRDNTRVINNTALTVSQFRDSGGTGTCSYALSPTSRSFSAGSNSSSVDVITGSTCAWTATVNAPSPQETSLPSKENSLPMANVLQSPTFQFEASLGLSPDATLTNSTSISIPSGPGGGAPYPSTINASGLTGTVTKVTVRLNSISHSYADDVGVLLVGPTGVKVRLMTDVGGNGDFIATSITFDDTAASMPDNPTTNFVGGLYKPTQGTNTSAATSNLHPTSFPAPAPGSPYSLSLASLNGQNPNGTWSLFVDDDSTGDAGTVSGGWTLNITTSGGTATWINITSGSSGTGNGTVNYTVGAHTGSSSRTGTITVNGQTHTINQAGTSTNYTIALSVSPSTGGTVSGGGTFAAGSSRTVTATANSGYTFTNWTQSGSVVSSSASYTFTLNSNRTLVANFTANTYTINVSASPSAGGTVSGGGTFAAGSSRTVTATANSGYSFTNWTQSGSVVSSSASYTFTLNSNRTLVANFTANTYTINVSASPSAGGTVSGGGTFAAGSSRTVTATANSGYTFTNWTQSGSVVSSSASYTFTLNSNRSLVANFALTSTGNAAYDSALKAPKCGQPGSVCDSGTLLNGRDTISGGNEPNQPNTINNSCADGTLGAYHVDESIDKIKISTLDGSTFGSGKTIKIEVTVWAFSLTDDFLDLFYASDATNPNWEYIGSLSPSVVGLQVLSATFTLPAGANLRAIRANFVFQEAVSPCSVGNYDDHDDLIFAIGGSSGQPFQLLLEQFGPVANQAAALDSLLMLRDPFPVVNTNSVNNGGDKNTRVLIFLSNFQLGPGETAASVVVNLVGSNNQIFDVVAEDVRPLANSPFTQVTFRLPNGLAVGTCTLTVKARGQVSNVGVIRIRA